MEINKPHPKDPNGLKLIFRSVSHRNYRLFFGGQGVSLIGTWIQQLAMSWLVYRMTNSAFLLGVVGFTGQIPSFLLTPFAGVLIDRWNRHRILILTQSLAMMQAFLLSALDLTGKIAIWHIILLSLFLGLVNAFDMPTRQAFVVEMIENSEDLGNAIALNSLLFNGARLLGPSIGGMLISLVSEGICFLLNGISFFAVIIALLAMKVKPRAIQPQDSHVISGLREGFTYTFGFAPIRTLLFLLGLVSIAAMPYTVLMPIFAKNILQGGSHTLGFLMGASGIGALVGAIYLASRKNVLGLGRLIVIALNIFGIGLITFALSRIFPISLILMVLVGFGMMVQMASSNTIIQTIVEEDKRGRVMSFYTMAFMGMVPFGSLLAGSMASKVGASGTVMIGGIVCILGSILFVRRLPSLREMVRPIYIKKGILPE
ncbi:MAG: MFS transporter [Syntrophaceae bacterium]|nr:MFS transporter [Syntrophaceae bacterium]